MITSSLSSYDWAVSITTDGNFFMLWFDKALYRDQNGKTHWQVSDAVIIPALEENQGITVSACLLMDVPDPEIVTLVNIDEESLERRWLSNQNIVLAWRANQSTGKLESMSTANIECNAETFLGGL